MTDMKPYPKLCMRCKKRKVATAGRFYIEGVLTAWHYVCYCGWKARGGRYPTINYKEVVNGTTSE